MCFGNLAVVKVNEDDNVFDYFICRTVIYISRLPAKMCIHVCEVPYIGCPMTCLRWQASDNTRSCSETCTYHIKWVEKFLDYVSLEQSKTTRR